MKLAALRNPAKNIILYTSISILLLALVRMLLWVFNPHLFQSHGFWFSFNIIAGGLLFDLCTFCLIHLSLLPLLFIPSGYYRKKWLRHLSRWLLFAVSFVLFAPSLIDVIYFRFTLKRTTWDVFNFLNTIGNEMDGLATQFVFDFWYILLIFIAVVALQSWNYHFFLLKKREGDHPLRYGLQIIAAVVVSILLMIGSRGSFGMRPLGIMHATKVAGPDYAPLVLNSTFTMIKTFGKKDLEVKSFFSDQEAEYIFSPAQCCRHGTDSTRHDNVVIIICESLSAEHMGQLNNQRPSYTPFLDSLSQHALLFDNMYANGKKSLEGIPAVLSGLPALMQNPFVTSMYAGNRIDGVGRLLSNHGYSSAFFHGGENGTMNFDGFASAAGYKKYYGKNEYPGPESDFDGRWGIFDEPWLQFTASTLNSMKEPFTACIFTLSAHHPYTIPQEHKGRFPVGEKPILETMAYADYALSQFFKTVSKKPWYHHTLFIITADHTSELYSDDFRRFPNNYTIPMIWFHPGDSSLRGRSGEICQQTDILPSIADYLMLPDSVFSFGQSVFEKNKTRFAVMMNETVYQIVLQGNVFFETDFESYRRFTPYRDCRTQTGSKAIAPSEEEAVMLLKAVVQQFNNRTIHNRLTK